MSYFKEIEKLLDGFTIAERVALVERFHIDLLNPEQMLNTYPESKRLQRIKIREIEKKALSSLHPENLPTKSGGPECTLCGISELEVVTLAKHESGFNVCNQCTELAAEVMRE